MCTCLVLFLPVYSVFKCFRSSHACHMCSLFLFLPVQSLLVYFRSSLTRFSTFHCVLRLSNSSLSLACETIPTAVHCAFLFFDAKAWPQSQTDLFKCTMVGIPFCSSCKRQPQTSKFDGKDHNTTSPSHMITHYRYVRVTERYMKTLHVKKMADLVVVYKFITLLTFELSSFRENGF